MPKPKDPGNGGGGGGGTDGGGGSLQILGISEDTGTAGDGITSVDEGLTLNGTGTAGATVYILVDGIEVGSVVVDEFGEWSFTFSDTFGDGAYTLTAETRTFHHKHGARVDESDSFSLTVDTTAPAPPPVPTLVDDAGTPDADNTTADTTPDFSGTAEAGSLVIISVNEIAVGETVAASDGSWHFDWETDAYADVDPLVDGEYSVTVTATDAAGNPSATSSALQFTIGTATDTTAPTASDPDLVAGSDSGVSDSDNLTNDPTATFRFGLDPTVVAGDTIELLIDGIVNVTHEIDAADISAGYVDLTSTTLNAGTNEIWARLSDAEGNWSVTGKLQVTYDGDAPLAPAGLDLADGSDTGESSSDDVTYDGTPTITGTGEAGATVKLYAGAIEVGSGVVDGSGNWSITTSNLADGTHNLTAKATDAAGNESLASTALTVTVDTVAPVAPQIDAVLMADGSAAAGGVTDDDTPEIQGTAEANSKVEIFVNGNSIGTTTTDQNGNWSIVAAALTDAVYTVTAEAVDLAGNTSPLSGSFMLEVDAVADEPAPTGGSIDPTDDPLYTDQWHLNYLGDIETIWQDYGGWNVSVGVYDDGIDYTHPDLFPNYDSSKHVWVDGVQLDPAPPEASAVHGTAVSGVIAAADNMEGGVGVAPSASLTGVNIFSGPADINGTDVSGFSEAIDQAWTFDVINNSWGTLPNYNHETDPALLAALAGFETAVFTGRGGLGTIVVKAAGNDYDSSQEFLNASRYTITVAAHDEDADASWYTNRGANLLVSAPSSGSGADGDDGILTTDRQGSDGYASGNYTYGFGGTSSASPVVSGVVALMLDANPNLGARDVQTILAYSAHLLGIGAPETAPVPSDSDGDGVADTTVEFPVEFFDWFRTAADNWNGGGLHFSEDYGFGGVNAFNAVRMAEVWSLFGDAQTFGGPADGGNEVIYAGAAQTPALAFDNQWVEATYNYIGPQMELEYVEVYVDFTAGSGGLYGNMEDVSIELVSPSGTVASLIQASNGYDSTSKYMNPFQGFESGGQVTWTFGVNAFRGEDTSGDWTVRIVDIDDEYLYEQYDGGVLNEFQISFYGAAPNDNDVYHYTDEFFAESALDPSRLTLTDSAGTDDWLNMAAMTESLTVDLAAGTASRATGGAIVGSGAEDIEHVVTGDGNDSLTGNDADNQLVGRRGDDEYWGGLGDDLFIFYSGDGNDWIWDFDDGNGAEDVIALYGFGFETIADFQITSYDNVTLLDFNGDGTITLAGITDSTTLSNEDFLFA